MEDRIREAINDDPFQVKDKDHTIEVVQALAKILKDYTEKLSEKDYLDTID